MDYKGKLIENEYRIYKKLGDAKTGNSWLAQNNCEENYVVKILKKKNITNTNEGYIRFKNNIQKVKDQLGEGMPKIKKISEDEDLYYIITDYISGDNLQSFINKGIKFSIEEVVDIVYKMCKILKTAHDLNIIHTNISPKNIILNKKNNKREDFLQVYILNFCLNSIRSIDFEKDFLFDKFYYISPEQSGYIKRNIDVRSDLYSIGILFYQLLTNSLPFRNDNLNKLIFMNISTIPQKLVKIKPGIPLVLENIILKLLKKNPSKRYQNIDGLIKDLEKFKSGYKYFEVGLEDNFSKLDYRIGLINRDKEFQFLISKLNSALNKRGSICLIKGEAGIGKTRFIEEFQNYVYGKKVIFLYASCLERETKIPLSVFKEALNTYLKYYKNHTLNEREIIKKEIEKNIGDLGEVLVKFNPSLKCLIDTTNSAINLNSDKEIFRLGIVIREFLKGLSNYYSAVVLVLEDLQWIDEGSLRILKIIIPDISMLKLIIVGSYNEIENNCSIKRFIDFSVENKYKLFRIVLKPFEIDDLNKFISELLFDRIENFWEVTNYLYQSSKGNPYFAIEILKYMVKEKVIYLKERKWVSDKEKLSNMKGYLSVEEVILKRIKKMKNDAKFVLSIMSAIGNKIDVDILLEFSNNKKNIVENLYCLISNQFLEFDILDDDKISFTNNKIKQAYYNFLDRDEKLRLHDKIANIYEKFNNNDYKRDFELAYHYLKSNDNKNTLKYLYPAGLKSKECFAYEDSINYFNKLISILEEENNKHELWVDSKENLSELYILTGKSKKAIEIYKEDILAYKINDFEKANIYLNISRAYFKVSDYKNCEKNIKKGLAFLNIKFPTQKWFVLYGVFREFFIHIIHKLLLQNFLLKEKKNSTKYKLAIQFLYYANRSYIKSNGIKLLRTTLQTINISESKIGKSKELAVSLMSYAVMCMTIPMLKRAKRYFYYSLKIKEELDDQEGIAQSYCMMSHYYNWKGDYNKGIKYGKKGLSIYKKIGELIDLCDALNPIVSGYYYLSDYKNMKRFCDQFNEEALKSNDEFAVSSAYSFYSKYYREKGDFKQAEKYTLEQVKITYNHNDWFMHCVSNIELGIIYLETKRFTNAIKCFNIARIQYEKSRLLKQYVVFLYANFTEVLIMDYVENKNEISKKERLNILNYIENMNNKSLKESKKWVTHYGNSLRVSAKLSVLKRDLKHAEKLFLSSINLNRNYRRRYDQAKSLFDYGMFLKLELQENKAKKILEEAYNLFEEIGSEYYQDVVRKELGITESEKDLRKNVLKEIVFNKKISSIISLSHDISSILDLDNLLTKVLDITMELSRAQNGHIFIKNEYSENMDLIIEKINDVETNYISENIIKEVLYKGEPVLTSNASFEDKFSSYQSVVKNDLKSILCLPIKYYDEIKGVCFLVNNLSNAVFKEEDIMILNSIMTQAAISIENAKLYRMAVTDGLTGLIVHKHFKFLLEKEVSRSLRFQKHFTLIMFDIDNFKRINDKYGHQAGDQVLINISKITKENYRSSDILARYGGEEFAVILTETSKNGAVECTKRLREKIEKFEIDFDGYKIKVTVSIGIAFFPEDSSDDIELFKFADKALYFSKETGRNRITLYKDIYKNNQKLYIEPNSLKKN
ncbi:MAG: diguanylate cyclase [Clostridiales bacterium]